MTDSRPFLYKTVPFLFLIIIVLALFWKTTSYDVTDNDDDIFVTGSAARYTAPAIFMDLFKNNVYFGGNTNYYRPVLILTFMIDNKIGGDSASISHLTNILLHVFSVLLLFFFLQKYVFPQKTALLASMLFAVHPLAVYTATWIPGRNDSLFFILFFICLILLLEYNQKRKIYYLAAHFLAVMVLLFTKESAIIIPAVFIVYFITHGLKEKKVHAAVICAVWLFEIVIFLMMRNAVFKNEPSGYLLKTAVNFRDYGMFFEYYYSVFLLRAPIAVNSFSKIAMLSGALLAVALPIFSFICAKDKKKIIFYIVLPFILLLPTVMAGRVWFQANRMYLPMFAIIVCLFTIYDYLAGKYKDRERIITAAVVAAIILCSYITWTKLPVFQNGVTFFGKMYDESKHMGTLIPNLYAYSLLKHGYLEEAFEVASKTTQPNAGENTALVYNMGNYYIIKGDYLAAAKNFEKLSDREEYRDLPTYARLVICCNHLNAEDAKKYYYSKALSENHVSQEEFDKVVSDTENQIRLQRELYEKHSAGISE